MWSPRNAASFTLSNDEVLRKDNEYKPIQSAFYAAKDDYIKKHGLIELKCDYMGMDSYYWSPTSKTMFIVNNITSDSRYGTTTPVFAVSNDNHILSLNGLHGPWR